MVAQQCSPTPWPLEAISSCLDSWCESATENGVFSQIAAATVADLHCSISTSDEQELVYMIGHADLVFDFLLRFCSLRSQAADASDMQQALECARALVASDSWAKLLQKSSAFQKTLGGLPANAQEAFLYQPKAIQFKSWIQEVRYKTNDESPSKSPASSPVDCVVNKQVEVFSKSYGTWCSGYAERVVGDEVVVAFQLPGALSGEWAKKQLSINHDELRWAGDAPKSQVVPKVVNVVYQDTALPSNWSPDELGFYDNLFKELDRLDYGGLTEYLQKSRLPPKVVSEVMQVANPDLKTEYGLDEFRSCCRLIAHCQAMSRDERLRKKPGALRSELRCTCLCTPVATLPDFAGPPQ
mmetsp:Transcript_55856/g.88510  ORF Transcript_55856/g.88510 Transcript_55856/m.88510 type:complete len:355 (-) Transcript_55856:221-1285(-)